MTDRVFTLTLNIEEAAFDGKANEIYFIRFPQGEMVPREVALPLMNRLEDVTATN